MDSLIAESANVIDGATSISYTGRRLSERVERAAEASDSVRYGTVLALTPLSVAGVMRFLGVWASRRPIALVDANTPREHLGELVWRYQPVLITGVRDPEVHHGLGVPFDGYVEREHDGLGPCWERLAPPDHRPDPELGLLLSTSGSTGSPKLVRLPRTAVVSNARAIAKALEIGPADVAATCLPLFYSYGLSVLTSHLAAGAAVVVVDGGVLSRGFWDAAAAHKVTSLSGVPYSYQLLDRMRWEPSASPGVRVLTQAGGQLAPELIAAFDRKMEAVGGRMYVMWGQTEAAARMTVLPSCLTRTRLGSVGVPVEGGRITIEPPDAPGRDVAPGTIGEVVYRGPNVMWGYAESSADLADRDLVGGTLRTGDLGRLDEDGYLWLIGRLRRIAKVFGNRVSLDDVERLLAPLGEFAAVSRYDQVVVVGEAVDGQGRRTVLDALSRGLRLDRSGFVVESVDALPRLPNGKVDYRTLDREGTR